MKRKGFVILVLIGIVMLPVSFLIEDHAMAQSPSKSLIEEKFSAANKWLAQNNLTVIASPKEAFINDYVMVAGEGVPASGADSPAQRRLTAERAATVIAYRNLAEILEGVAVAGDTVVKNTSTYNDTVRVAVTGFIKGAQIVYKEYNEREEVALVIMKVGMTGPDGFAGLLYDKILGDPKIKKGVIEDKPPFQPKPIIGEAGYDGLIIDAREQGFRPALINRVFNPKGEVLYDPSKINQKVLVEQGCGEYTNSVDKARAALESRGVRNPLIVKAVGTLNPSDLKVSDEDAVKIFSANQKSNFFEGAKVAFVLK